MIPRPRGGEFGSTEVSGRGAGGTGAEGRCRAPGAYVVLGPATAGDEEVVGHEPGHVDKNLRGVRETGTDNGPGLSVTDPGQDPERTAAADGAAFAAGARTAPSAGAGGHGAGTVQRSAAGPAPAWMRSLQGTAGDHAVARPLAPGTAPVQSEMDWSYS